MLDHSYEHRAPVLRERDYIGLSETSSSATMNPALEVSDGALEDADLRLDLGLGLGLGSGFTKKGGEGEQKVNQGASQLDLSHASSVTGLVSPTSKKWMKRAFAEAAMPAFKSAEADASLAKQSSFFPTWAPTKPTVPAWHAGGRDKPGNIPPQKASASTDNLRGSIPEDPPPAKDRIVGWPPVPPYRRQTLAKPAEMFVKVNMDGMTVGRKVDLDAYSSYESLLLALEEMFQLSTSAQGAPQASFGRDVEATHFLLSSGSEFVLTYEDKDGDWMLVGDVPWSMFVSTVRRLRITRGLDATGSGTRAAGKSRLHV